MTGNFWGPFAGKFISPVRQFHGKANSLMVIPPKYGKIWVSLSFSLVYISLFASVTIVNGQNEWSQQTNLNRIQDGAWLQSSCV